MNKIKVGVIGLGYWGPNLVRVLSESPDFVLTYVADLKTEALDRVALRYHGIRATTSMDELLDNVEAVVIATPISTHYELARKSLLAGKATFVEKPLTYSVKTAIDLLDIAREQGLVLQVGHTFVYSPPVRKIKRMLDENELGEIYFVSSSRVNLGLFQKDVSVIWDLAVHDLSILDFWFGSSAGRVQARGRDYIKAGVHDVAFLSVDYPDRKLAHIEVSWLAPHKLRRMVLVGKEKMLVYDDSAPDEKIRVYNRGVMTSLPSNFGEYNITYRVGDMYSPHLESKEPLRCEMDDFAHCIRTGAKPQAGDISGLRVVCALEAAQASLQADGAEVAVGGMPERWATEMRTSVV